MAYQRRHYLSEPIAQFRSLSVAGRKLVRTAPHEIRRDCLIDLGLDKHQRAAIYHMLRDLDDRREKRKEQRRRREDERRERHRRWRHDHDHRQCYIEKATEELRQLLTELGLVEAVENRNGYCLRKLVAALTPEQRGKWCWVSCPQESPYRWAVVMIKRHLKRTRKQENRVAKGLPAREPPGVTWTWVPAGKHGLTEEQYCIRGPANEIEVGRIVNVRLAFGGRSYAEPTAIIWRGPKNVIATVKRCKG